MRHALQQRASAPAAGSGREQGSRPTVDSLVGEVLGKGDAQGACHDCPSREQAPQQWRDCTSGSKRAARWFLAHVMGTVESSTPCPSMQPLQHPHTTSIPWLSRAPKSGLPVNTVVLNLLGLKTPMITAGNVPEHAHLWLRAFGYRTPLHITKRSQPLMLMARMMVRTSQEAQGCHQVQPVW